MQGVKSDHPPGIVAICTGDTFRYSVSAQDFSRLRCPPNSAVSWQVGMLIGRSLNNAFQACMDRPDAQWVWIMGDDHTYDPDILLKLLDRNLDAVAPVCLNRLPPLDPVIVEHDHPGKGRLKYLEDLPTSGLYKLRPEETCGDASLLISRKVLEATGPNWHGRKSGSLDAEDQSYIQKVKDAGFDVFIDCDLTIGHITPITNRPVVTNGHWEIQLLSGGRPMLQMMPAPRGEPFMVP